MGVAESSSKTTTQHRKRCREELCGNSHGSTFRTKEEDGETRFGLQSVSQSGSC